MKAVLFGGAVFFCCNLPRQIQAIRLPYESRLHPVDCDELAETGSEQCSCFGLGKRLPVIEIGFLGSDGGSVSADPLFGNACSH